MQRPEQLAREPFGRSGPSRSVRPTVPTINEPPENNASGVGLVKQQIREVVGRVARRRDRAQSEAAEVDLVAVGDASDVRSCARLCAGTKTWAPRRAELGLPDT